jgi:uncharacterized protein YecT (DUF1311 family)
MKLWVLPVAALVIVQVAPGDAATSTQDDDDAWKQSLTPEVHACETAPENGGTFQQAICYRDELARQDARLNKIWLHFSKDHRAKLREGERRWISDRDKGCADEAAGYVNSTARYMYNICMVEETIERIEWLERGR